MCQIWSLQDLVKYCNSELLNLAVSTAKHHVTLYFLNISLLWLRNGSYVVRLIVCNMKLVGSFC